MLRILLLCTNGRQRYTVNISNTTPLPSAAAHMKEPALLLSFLSPQDCIRSVPSISGALTAGWGILTSYSPPSERPLCTNQSAD